MNKPFFSLFWCVSKAPSRLAEEIWKRIFIYTISTYRPHKSVTQTERFESALQTGGMLKRWLLVLVWTEKHFENGAFRKRSSNWRNVKTLAFGFSVDRKTF